MSRIDTKYKSRRLLVFIVELLHYEIFVALICLRMFQLYVLIQWTLGSNLYSKYPYDLVQPYIWHL
jgi:hypothetical protein